MRAIVCLTTIAAALIVVSSAHARPTLSIVPAGSELPAGSVLPEDLQATAAFPRVYLHGGPGSLEGSFQDAQGGPDWHAWTSVDLTDAPLEPYWQRSTFNAENLNGNGVGNNAMWCGRTAAQEPGWVAAPGYGNSWDAPLQWSSGPLSDPSVGRTVELDFFLNHDSEESYDLTNVRYRKNGQWVTVWSVDGRNSVGGVFDPPGVQFSTVGAAPIVFDGNDYAGPGLDEIVLQIWFQSDGGFSDEDGNFPSVAGAAQVDDILVRYVDGGVPQESFEDFEGSAPYAWQNAPPAVVGDFAKILVGLSDIDPCRENSSAQATFIDDGTPPNNLPGQSTGGSTSEYGTYGTPEGWVINLTGGIAGGTERLRNEIWSPPIALDAPGPEDDGPGWRPYLEYTVFYHEIGFTPGHAVKMRQSVDGVVWGIWKDLIGFYFFAGARPGYYDDRFDLEDRLLSSSNFIQIALAPIDPAEFGFGNPAIDDAATPAPWFDDVMVYKDRTGTLLSTERRGRPIDAFPVSPGVDVSAPGPRGLLDVPIDAYWFDSFTDHPRVEINPVGSSGPPQDLRMVWILEKNPLFEDALRTMPPGTTVLPGTSPLGGDRWTGSFPAQPTGALREYEFVAPDNDFLYPGDVLRWHVEVTSADGIVTTDPQDLTGFDTGVLWHEDYTVRALPSFQNAGGDVPSILVVDYDRRPGDDPRLLQAFTQNGLNTGIGFDYLRAQPNSSASFLGAQASDAQLALYSHLFVIDPITAGDTIAEDLSKLDTWYATPGDRHAVWIGRTLVSRLTFGPTAAFVTDRLGVELLGTDGRDAVGGRKHPGLIPQIAPFVSAPVLDLTCYGAAFDRLGPLPGAVVGHGITSEPPSGPVIADLAGSIIHDRTIAEGRRVDVTLPIDLQRLMTPRMKVDGSTAAATLVEELLTLFGHPGGAPTPTPPPSRAGLSDLSTQPNPFNPATTVRFTLGADGPVRVRIVNLRGEVVRTLHDGWLAAGEQRLRWDGRGDGGNPLASGVYLADVRGNGHRLTAKMALLK